MKVSKREVESALIVDLLGQFPEQRDEVSVWGNEIRDAIAGTSKSIVFNMPDAGKLRDFHIGQLLRAIGEAKVSTLSFSIVSPNPQIREFFQVAAEHIIRTYESEADALNGR